MERVPDVRTELGSDEATEGDWERDKGSTVSSISSSLPVQHLLLLITALVRAPQCHKVPCTVSPQVGATYRECRSDKGFTVEPNTRPQHHTGLRRTKRGLNMSTSHKYKKETKKTSTKVKVRKDVFEHRQQYRETQTHTLDHSSPLSSLFPDTKMYVAMHCALITVTLT